MLRKFLRAVRRPRPAPRSLLAIFSAWEPAVPAPPMAPASIGAVLAAADAAEEAAGFLGRDGAPPIERFGLLALSLDGAIERDRGSLQAIERIEARPLPHGRSHGLDWAYSSLFVDADRMRQAAALLRALAPHETAVRALLAHEEVVA